LNPSGNWPFFHRFDNKQALLQLQEAANAITEQNEQPLSHGGDSSAAATEGADHSGSTAPKEQVESLLGKMTMKELRALVDSPKYADRVLQVGESYFHAHKGLLRKRSSLLKNVFENDLDQTDRVVPLHMPDSDAYAFRLMLEYLYTGDIPDDTRLAQLLYR
jgi:BTB/POZ domain